MSIGVLASCNHLDALDDYAAAHHFLADLPEIVHEVAAVVSVLITLLIIIHCVKTYPDDFFSIAGIAVDRGKNGEKHQG